MTKLIKKKRKLIDGMKMFINLFNLSPDFENEILAEIEETRTELLILERGII